MGRKKLYATTRIKTHIKGFDELTQGGIPNESIILLSGAPGTGKTIFSLEVAYNALKNDKEKVLYLSFEEKKNALITQADQFGWDLKKYSDNGKLKIVAYDSEEIASKISFFTDIHFFIDSIKPKKIIIDSLTSLTFLLGSEYKSDGTSNVDTFLYQFFKNLKKKEDVLIYLISQIDRTDIDIPARYMADSIIEFKEEEYSEFGRSVCIKKMRRTQNDKNVHMLEMSKTGLRVHKLGSD